MNDDPRDPALDFLSGPTPFERLDGVPDRDKRSKSTMYHLDNSCLVKVEKNLRHSASSGVSEVSGDFSEGCRASNSTQKGGKIIKRVPKSQVELGMDREDGVFKLSAFDNGAMQRWAKVLFK